MSVPRVQGPNLILRLVQPDDADYVYALRTNSAYNGHLSEVRGTAEDQRRWIEAYKLREAVGQELYYVITRRDELRCGVVRLYNIERNGFTWGSWILDHNKPAKAALESAVLSFGIGFDILRLERALVDVRAQNERALAFYRRLGMTEIERTQKDVSFIYNSETFGRNREHYNSLLSQERTA